MKISMRVCSTMALEHRFLFTEDEHSDLTALALRTWVPLIEILDLPSILVSLTWELAPSQFPGFL